MSDDALATCSRLCPDCRAFTTHRVILPRVRWQCVVCSKVFERPAEPMPRARAPRRPRQIALFDDPVFVHDIRKRDR
jgi:hypothetical protein